MFTVLLAIAVILLVLAFLGLFHVIAIALHFILAIVVIAVICAIVAFASGRTR